jgi:Uma2 family endonuclease
MQTRLPLFPEDPYLYGMTQATRILPNYTYDEYCKWEGKWEIIDGIPYAMSPLPSLKHQIIASRLNMILGNSIAATGYVPCEVVQPIDIKISENTVVQPDLSIICSIPKKDFLDFPPVLVVEILSPSTREKDLITKPELYRGFGVKYYVIIDPENDSITAHILYESAYKKSAAPYTFELVENCTISPDLSGGV